MKKRTKELLEQAEAAHDFTEGQLWNQGGTKYRRTTECQVCGMKRDYFSDSQNGIDELWNFYTIDGDEVPLVQAVKCFTPASSSTRSDALPLLTHEDRVTIVQAVEYAIEAQQNYLKDGFLRADHGDEMEKVCERKAAEFRRMAALVRKCGAVELVKDAEQLAADFEARCEEE